MKNRVLQAALLSAALGGLLLGAAPAQATTLSWEDPAGDATPGGLPVPPLSEPSFDVTKVTVSSDGTNLNWEAAVPGIAAEPPPKGTGMHFGFIFQLGEHEYSFRISEDRIAGSAQAFYWQSDLLEPQDCGKCLLKIDREAKKITLKAPIASITRGVKTSGTGATFGAGTKMEALSVDAGPIYFIGAPGVASLTSFQVHETAAAPDPATFTV